MKLTDAQRIILAAAAARESGLVLPTPKSLTANSGTLGIIIKSLVNRNLLTERPILPDEPIWRESEELGRTTLVISNEGLQAIGIEPAEVPTQDAAKSPTDATSKAADTPPRPQSDVDQAPLPKVGTKLDALITGLRKPDGATIFELMQVTGWQSHSVRGAMSGNLKKKLKLDITSAVVGGRGRVYQIAEVVSE